MLVLRMSADDAARLRSIPNRGLLAWLYGDGLLLVPEDLQPPEPGQDDAFLAELTAALTEPL